MPTTSAPDSFPFWRSLAFAVGAFLVSQVPGTIYIIVGFEAGWITRQTVTKIPAIDLITIQLITYVPLVLFMLAVLPWVARRPLSQIGFVKPDGRVILIGIAGAIAMFLAVDLAAALMISITHGQPEEESMKLLAQMHTLPQRLLFSFLAAVAAPIVEEIGFRAFLFNAFRRYLPLSLAAVASGLIFGAQHIDFGHFNGAQALTTAVSLGCGGIVLAYVYAIARNIWANIITHALFNSVALIGVFVFHVKS